MCIKEANSYDVTVDTSMLDKSGAMTPDGLQRLIILATERELKKIGLEITALIKKYGVSWILLSMSARIEGGFELGEQITVYTRHTWKKGVIYRRDFALYNKDGVRVAVAATFSGLFDVQKRRICMDRSIYEQIDLPAAEELFDAVGRYTADLERFSEVDRVPVRPSWIDALGHVNNFRYGELVRDALDERARAELDKLYLFEAYFVGELMLGERAVIKACRTGDLFEVAGEHEEGGRPAFFARLHFNK